ncbi:di-trans,poly-cis-decaprenylcistransferase [Candidatus Micrarchaeota archaeon]|nr:di-trans,poly-cis-decaprenylcistransferase [Candidatus Micrarchaeota archaeon]
MENVPAHIAIIPDGNRRWGRIHGISKKEAYAIGIKKIGDVAEWCRRYKVKMLTMWGFSTDNFKRDREEVEQLFELFKTNLIEVIREGSKREEKKKIKVRFLGRTDLFPKQIQNLIKKAEDETSGNDEYQLNILLSYGGRGEIVDAVNKILAEGIKKVDEKTISEHLYTAGIPDPDLVIRTSGEKRLSGLLPWQTTYSEFYFCDKLWPDFSEEDFAEALKEYESRGRRFGK